MNRPNARALLMLVAALFTLLGCGDDSTVVEDSSMGRPDALPDACISPPCDAGADSATPTDGAQPDAVADAAAAAPTVDGVIGVEEWEDAVSVTNAVASGWGTENNLTRLRALVRGDTLYLAIEGQLEAGAENAIVVYVDGSRGSGEGVTDPADLMDGEGALDNAVSAGITTPADVQVDLAWGTKDFGRAAEGFDARMGWRNVADTPSDFAWLDAGEAPSVCSESACETSVALSALPGPGDLALFARLVNTDGMMLSNQCVPEDDADMPSVVSTLLDVPR